MNKLNMDKDEFWNEVAKEYDCSVDCPDPMDMKTPGKWRLVFDSVLCGSSNMSIEVKADTIYQLTAEYDTEDKLCFQLIDTGTQAVVSQPQTKNEATFDYKDFRNISFQSTTTWRF